MGDQNNNISSECQFIETRNTWILSESWASCEDFTVDNADDRCRETADSISCEKNSWLIFFQKSSDT